MASACWSAEQSMKLRQNCISIVYKLLGSLPVECEVSDAGVEEIKDAEFCDMVIKTSLSVSLELVSVDYSIALRKRSRGCDVWMKIVHDGITKTLNGPYGL